MDNCYHCYSRDNEQFFQVKPGFVAHAMQTGESAEGEHGEIYYEDYILHPNRNVLVEVAKRLIHNQMMYRRNIEREMTRQKAEQGFRLSEVASIVGLSAITFGSN